MKSSPVPARHSARRYFSPSHILALATLLALAASSLALPGFASAARRASGQSTVSPAAADTCAAATVINPAALPFLEDATTEGASNDIDPGIGGCTQAPGPDVVYSFTPTATDTYTIGATPMSESFDLSLYIVTDCANPAGSCVAAANIRGAGKGESLAPTLNAGTRYFIVVDSVQPTGTGPFHFALRRGRPANDSCAAPVTIEPSRLPFSAIGTTFGATSDSNPGAPCLRTNLSGSGPDVVYQFTPADSQVYQVTITPIGSYDASVYIVTNCATGADCTGADVGGNGAAEIVRRNLTAGTTYFIVVDGFSGDAGDFRIFLEPSIPLAPPAPSDLTATAVSSTEIDLAWHDNSSNELGFRIERSLDGQNFTQIAELGPNTTGFNDTGLTPATTYFYRVFAFNNFGQSDPSNIAADTTQAPPPPQFPVINVTPTLIDFGTVRASQSLTRTITISNTGAANLVITDISNPPAPFSIVDKPALPLTVAPAQSIELTVRFAPTSAQQFTGSFTIQSNAPQSPSVTVDLRGVGIGVPVPNIEITPSFGNFPSGSSVTPIEIKNTGDADLIVSSIIQPASPFFLGGLPNFPVTLKPGESFTMTLSFSPAAPGVFVSQMIVVNNDPDTVLFAIPLRGTSTPQSEILKLRVPTSFTAVIGQSNTITVIAFNGTNSDIHLTASSIAGGAFTDRGNGRGDLVFTPTGTTRSTMQVTFTATDSANRTKSLVAAITIVPATDIFRVQVSWTAPQTAPGAPTNALAVNRSFQQLRLPDGYVEAASFEPADAAGLIGYAVYRSATPGAATSLGNIVGVVPATATSFNDLIPTPGGTSFVMPPAFYTVTALYATGSESNASNETSTEPRLANLQFKKKRLRFDAANSNVEVGAVLVVDGAQTFTLERNGNFIEVGKDARSAPGNLRVRDIFTSGSSHTVQVRNPHGPNSRPLTFTR
ncbi:MAG TPA: choice-of-anchor D domain-containing protein [Blastocatellia bacterium]|nr:choice-of-anchor D domain-containing protein [Blastocatellia bacterium]